jgi:hypothetical protein
MNNLAWQAGKNLKRFIETSGRFPTLNQYAVLLWLFAQENGHSLEDVVQALILASTFESQVNKLDREATIRELGFS